MKVNWLILAAGILYTGGAIQYFARGQWQMGIVFMAYAVANFAFTAMGMEG